MPAFIVKNGVKNGCSHRRFVLAALVMIVATIALGRSDIQFRTDRALPVMAVGPANSAFIGSASGTGCSTQSGYESSRRDCHVAALPERADAHRWLRLVLTLDGDIAGLGPDPARPPIAATWFTRPDGSRQDVSLAPLGIGPLEQHRHTFIRAWPEHATSVVASIMPRAMHGQLSLQGLSVEIVSLSGLYRTLLTALLIGWVGLAIGVLHYVRTRFSSAAILFPLALVASIITAVMFSTDVINNVVRPIVSLAHGTRAGVSLVATFKIGHGVAFAVLTFSLLTLRHRLDLSPANIGILIALLAIATESAQLHLPARTAQLSDLGIDAIGASIGALLWLAARAVRAPREADR